jgi:hypothetical protein
VLTLAHEARPAVSRRERVRGRAGVWFRVASGALRGYWVAEDPERVYLPGRVATVLYSPPRRATLGSGRTYCGYAYREDGSSWATSTVTVSNDVVATVSACGIVNGVPHALMCDGPLAGLWVPLLGVTLD